MSNLSDLKRLSVVQHAIGGIIRIVISNEESTPRTYCIEDLGYTNILSIAECFRAIREFYGKTEQDYGVNWVRYSNGRGEVSNKFITLQNELKSYQNDLQKLQRVCEVLGEMPLVVLSKEETQKNLEVFKTLQ